MFYPALVSTVFFVVLAPDFAADALAPPTRETPEDAASTSRDPLGCAGTVQAKLIVLQVDDADSHNITKALSAMKEVMLAEQVADTMLVRVLADGGSVTVERIREYIRLAGYDVNEATQEQYGNVLKAMQANDGVVVMRRVDSDKPRKKNVAFPDTTAGKLAKGYIDAYNTGNDEAIRSFELANRSQDSLKSRPMEDRLQQYRGFYKDWGKLEVQDIKSEGSSDIIVEAAVSKRDLGLRLHFEVEDSTGKLNAIQVSPTMGGVHIPSSESDPSVRVTSLEDSIEPLRSRFNEFKNKTRFVALLSPT